MVYAQLRVSTHAPAWGANLLCHYLYPSLVSIHAPAWARTELCSNRRGRVEFQSTRPRGREPAHRVCRRHQRSSQPTRPRGRERRSLFRGCWRSQFQSTRPRGRARLDLAGCSVKCFNPRARARARLPTGGASDEGLLKFQPTRPRGRERPHTNTLFFRSLCSDFRVPKKPLPRRDALTYR